MSNRAYDSIRSLVERLGGSMVYKRKGYRHGVLVIKIGENMLIDNHEKPCTCTPKNVLDMGYRSDLPE